MSRLTAADLSALEECVRLLDEAYPLKNPTPADFASREAECRFHRYCGRRDLIDDLKAIIRKRKE